MKRDHRRRKRQNRRLLLQNLENRQLLAGDVPMLPDTTAMHSDSSHAMVDMAQGTSTATHSAVEHTQHGAHAAAMALVSADQATNTVVASGNWSDPQVWSGGVLPQTGARIVIPEGMTLTVDSVMPTEFKTIGIQGTLGFATDVNTELRVDTLVSHPQGRLEIGTAASPIASDVTAKVVFADDGAIDTTWDPEQLSRGAVLHGSTEIHGAETTHRATLAEFPRAGATSIHLNNVPVNWKRGDEIVITGTQGSTSDEVRTIDSIDGASVAFTEPLQLDHVPPKSDLNVYVANKTRNVQFSSENPEVSRRGHIMLMHTLDVNIQNAEFRDLGRTDKTRELDDVLFEFPDAVGNETSAPVVFTTTTGDRTNVRGRYAVHFHRGGVDPNSSPAVVSGSVVDGSPGWGLVNHSSNVDMINNVAYGVQGAAFYTEVGDEIGSMVGNIAIRTVNPQFTLDDEGAIDPDLRLDRMDFGVDGDGFWLSGHMVSMRDNVSAGASGHGIIIWSDGVIEPDLARGRSSVKVANLENGNLITGRDTIPTWWAPLSEISNNESYGATIGFRSRYVHSAGYLGEIGSPFHTPPDQAYIDALNPTIDGLTVWGSRDGMLMNYNERMSIKNARLIGIGAPYVQNGGTADTGVGIDMYNEVTRGPGVIENVSVEGFNMGILAPRQDSWRVNNVHLSNTTDMLITEARQAPRNLDLTNVTFGSLADTAVADQASQRRNIVMTADFDADAHQPFFFLMSDVITLDGQQLYFNEQAPNFIPITQQIDHEAVRLPQDMIGQTNQQLMDRFGTSFAGAMIPSDATSADFLTGGVIGSVASPPATSPPLYDVASEGAGGVLVDPGTLTNFSGPTTGPGGGDESGDESESDDDVEPDEGEESDTDEGEDDDEADESEDGESGDESESDDDAEPDEGEESDTDEGEDDDEADESEDGESGDESESDGDAEPDEGEESDTDEGEDDDEADESEDGESGDDSESDEDAESDDDEGSDTDEGEDGDEVNESDDDESGDESESDDETEPDDDEGSDTDEGEDDGEADESEDGEAGDESESDEDAESDDDEGSDTDEAEDDDEADESGDDEEGDESESDEDTEPDEGEESDTDEGEDDDEVDEADDEEDGEDSESGEDADGQEGEEPDAEDGSDDETDESDDDEDGDDSDSDEDTDGEEGEESDADDADEDDEPVLHNSSNPTDVNNDGSTSALDALLIINFLSRQGSSFLQTLASALQSYVDVNNDQSASALDALVVINRLAEAAANPAGAVDLALMDEDEDEEDDELFMLLAESR